MGLPPASPYAIAGGCPGTTGFSERVSSYTANHVQSMEQLCPDPNGVGAGPRPVLPGLGVSYVQEHLPPADGFLLRETHGGCASGGPLFGILPISGINGSTQSRLYASFRTNLYKGLPSFCRYRESLPLLNSTLAFFQKLLPYLPMLLQLL